LREAGVNPNDPNGLANRNRLVIVNRVNS